MAFQYWTFVILHYIFAVLNITPLSKNTKGNFFFIHNFYLIYVLYYMMDMYVYIGGHFISNNIAYSIREG